VWQIRESAAKSILTPVTGFLKEAGFTHSLSPAHNCTYGCTYCYVPSLGVFGGLKREDWTHWGQFTTLKMNAAELAEKQARRDQVIYCSPLVDPYQPAERNRPLMPKILEAFLQHPPRVLVLQTRASLILRDIELLQRLRQRTIVRVSFSITTNREEVRRRYEPHCETNEERLATVRELSYAGVEAYATLAPLLPCDPEELAQWALEASGRVLIGDPLHVRATKRWGATTRRAAFAIARRYGELDWFEPEFQNTIVGRIRKIAIQAGLDFLIGPEGFGLLAR
jgi:DNA repair photolyase